MMASPEIFTFYDSRALATVNAEAVFLIVEHTRPVLRWLTKDVLLDPLPYDIAPSVESINATDFNNLAPRALLFTTHPIQGCTYGDAVGACARDSNGNFTAIVDLPYGLSTKNDSTFNLTLGRTMHELGHGYGLGDCAMHSCVMFPYRSSKSFNSQQPFCGIHPLRKPK